MSCRTTTLPRAGLILRGTMAKGKNGEEASAVLAGAVKGVGIFGGHDGNEGSTVSPGQTKRGFTSSASGGVSKGGAG